MTDLELTKLYNKLTKKELVHLIVTTGSHDHVVDNCHKHSIWRREGKIEPCWECKTIATKLGLPT